MRVVGTAGHVDHGKSTLVQALTGINPDRLKEEQEREMTIDLGFAWLTLPSGLVISLVDVPGHEAFIKNMLAGVGGLDAVLMVIAADEGMMPQTREHLAILDLLHVKGGLVALTKIDLAENADWLELVQGEVRAELHHTFLANAPIVAVSARKGLGLEQLKSELDKLLAEVSPKANLGRPRLPIDRVFTVAGFGTVVTGTLSDGAFAVGDEVEILPSGKKSRVRSLQRHRTQVEQIEPGTRLAMNLAGLAKEEIARGEVVVHPNTYASTSLIDARIEWLSDAPKLLKHNDELDFFAFTQEIPARVRLLDRDEMKPGESAWGQIVLETPAVLARDDRFILRIPSPSLTVGGGGVAKAHSPARYRRKRKEVIANIETSARGTPDEILFQYLATRELEAGRELAKATGLQTDEAARGLEVLVKRDRVILLGTGANQFALTRPNWQRLTGKITDALDEYHRLFPLREGMPREELKSKLNLSARAFDLVFNRAWEENFIAAGETTARRPEFRVEFSPDLQKQVDQLMSQFKRAAFNAPTAQEVESTLGGEALNVLIAQKQLVRLNEQVLFAPEVLRQVTDWLVAQIQTNGQVTAAELRDHFETSRKYAIALLEYLDERRVTKRVGDARVLR